MGEADSAPCLVIKNGSQMTAVFYDAGVYMAIWLSG